MNKKISASMMCANPLNLGQILRSLEEHEVDYLHIDIMDGVFVPNLGIGLDYVNALRESTTIPFDFHLMVNNPDNILPILNVKPNDIISIHYESTFQVQRTLENVKKKGCKVFLAINPATPINSLEEVIFYIDGINMLMVNPGFAGQKIVDSCFKKMEKLRTLLVESGRLNSIDIEVDGNITIENAKRLANFGANIFVGGTSSIFTKEGINEEMLIQLSNVINSSSPIENLT